MVCFSLPYPPSVNHYWRYVGSRVLLSWPGRVYRERVRMQLAEAHVLSLEGTLSIRVDIHPPDKRRRDLDNVLKSLLDALQYGGAFRDDSQIVRIIAEKRENFPKGRVMVSLEQCVVNTLKI